MPLPKVLKEPNFLKLWLAQFFSQVGLNALYFILTIKIYEVTGSNTFVSLLILAFTAPSIFLGYIAGVYVDQFSLKKVMLATNLLRALAVVLLLLLFGYPFSYFVIVFLLALATLFFIPAEGSALPALVADKNLIIANSLFSLSLQVSLSVGFLLGSLSLRTLGEINTVLVILFLFLISLILNILLPRSIRLENLKAEKNVLKRFLQGLGFVIKTKKVRDAIFFLTLTSTIVFVLATVGPGYIDKVLKLDLSYVGALIVLPATLGMGIGSLILGRWGENLGARFWVNSGLFGMGVTFLVLSKITKLIVV